MQIDIPRWIPTSVNKLMSHHWASANRLKRADTQMIGVYAAKASIPKAEGKRRVLTTITVNRGRAPDPDNLQKSLNDALVKCGLLVDDSHIWLETKPVIIKRGKAKHTTIILEDM